MKARRRRTAKHAAARRGRTARAALAFDGFHVLVADTNARAALVTARNAVDHVLGNAGGWRVVLLPSATREFRVVPALPEYAPALSEAWELARALRRERGIEAAEVALIGPGLQPPHPTRHLAPFERAAAVAKSFVTSKNLECSAPYDWHVCRVHAPAAWTLPNAKGAGVTVAHPDTGYTLHPEIWSPTPSANRIRAEEGFDFVGGDGDPLDDLVGSSWTLEMPGHGTATASVIMSTPGAQMTDPHPGGPTVPFVTGIAPEAELVPIRVSTSVVHLSYANLVDGLRHAIAGGHPVASMSLGGPLPSDALDRAVHDAVASGMILIAAAGNYYPFVVFPAALDEVIAVAATNCRDEPWQWSASGPAVDLSAPGESIWIALSAKGKPYNVERNSGTSFATAATAGAAAAWLSHHGRANLIALYGKANLSRVFKRVLTTSGAVPPAEWDATRYGAGILDVDALLRAPLPAGAPPPKAITATTAAHRLDRIANFFPTLAPDEVRRGVAAVLRTSPEAVEEALDDVGQELAVHIAVDPSLREAIHRAGRPAEPLATRKGPRAAKKAPTRYAASAHLRATASKRLRARIGTPTSR